MNPPRVFRSRCAAWLAAAIVCFAWLTVSAENPPPSEALDGAAWDERIASSLQISISTGNWWIALLAAWVGGLLTSFTPCVWPLVPITIRFFGGLRKSAGKDVLLLAITYVLGMMALYTTLGLLFASSGKVFGSLLSMPWVVWALALFCLAMGLSMLGAFTIRLPTELNTRLSQVGGRSLEGALTMGFVSGLVAAPCTGPVLAVILTFVASAGTLAFGFWLMCSFSLGLGMPLLALALLSGKQISLGRPCVELVETVLASAMFIVSVYFFQIAWPGFRTAFSWIPFGSFAGFIIIVAGLGAGALLISLYSTPRIRLPRIVTTVLLTLGFSIILFGEHRPSADSSTNAIVWITSHVAGMTEAKEESKPVIIDFTAEWCTACKELDRKTYVDPEVQDEAKRFVTIKIDATVMDDNMETIFDQYGVLGLPTVVFIASKGEILNKPRVTGFVSADRFLKMMRSVR